MLTTKPNAPDSVTASQFLTLLRQGAVAAGAAAPKQVLGAKAVVAVAAAVGSSSSEGVAVVDPWAPFLKLIRGLTPTALDRELRSMQVGGQTFVWIQRVGMV